MRLNVLVFLPISLLSGCAGNVADHIGPRAPIVTPQLSRYGLDPNVTQCVGLRLGDSLTPLQLRRFARQAATVERSFFGSPGLGLRDLVYVASQMPDPRIPAELDKAIQACGESVRDSSGVGASEASPEMESNMPAQRGPVWLNLGSATSGQAIAVDASSLVQDSQHRIAWFRLTNPGANASTGIHYLLRIDCNARTISPQADRRHGPDGTVLESREYETQERGPMPIEGGTVMEIAFLSLCTSAG